jgi:NADH:ubiquinone oxidoreductase subunit 2 (subunit N)
MTSIRRTIGVALLSSLTIIILSGFIANTSHDMFLVFFGFLMGLITVYVLEAVKRRDDAIRSSRAPSRDASMSRRQETPPQG